MKKYVPSIVLFNPISFSFSCNTTINSAGVNSSLCLTRGTFDVMVPNDCGGVVTIELNTDRTTLFGSGVPLSIETIRGKCRRISACQTPLNSIHYLGNNQTHTLSISAIMGIKKRASRSLSETRALTSVTSCVLGLPLSVKIAMILRASDSDPLGKVRRSVSNLPCEEPRARMSGLISSWICSWAETSICPYAANILSKSLHVNRLARVKMKTLTHRGTRAL